jgi:23S rRNA (cytosine1962-C5)-methyltransferase
MPSSIILHPTREKSAKQRHPWIFSKAVAQVKGRIGRGDTVDVLSDDGEWLGRGAYSPDSQIRVRFWTFDKNQTIDHVFFLNRLKQAKALRESLQLDSTAYRLVAGESDGLPGVTIDLFDRVAVVQLLSAGADKHREKIVDGMQTLFPDVAIYERSDVAVREKEGLQQVTGVLAGNPDAFNTITEHGLTLKVDIKKGHKTGFYLDQRASRLMAKRLSKNKTVLNCFSYTCTFACAALAGGASHVTNIDVSRDALDIGIENLLTNGFSHANFSQQQDDVFEALRAYHQSGKQFDLVILDPPKFVDSKAGLQRAARGYKDINLFGIHAVKHGGLLMTFTCSGLMPQELFQKIVADAALDAKRNVQIIHYLSQDSDHPVLSSYPQGHYLKGLVCRVFD